jgi:uncharacterized protein YeaC (DUF1315 family)
MKTTEFIKESIDQPEYNDEVGMVKNNLHTLVRTSVELAKSLQGNENLPEWCQEKIAVAKSMIVAVGDYMISQHEMGQQPEVDSFDMDRAFAEAMDEADLSVKGNAGLTPIQGDKVEIKFGYNDYYDQNVTRGEVLQIRPDGYAVVGMDRTGTTENFPVRFLKVIGARAHVPNPNATTSTPLTLRPDQTSSLANYNKWAKEKGHVQEDAVKYGVFSKGGSIGSQKFKDEPLKTFDSKEEAIADARRRRSSLSKGERGYYRMGYVVKAIKGVTEGTGVMPVNKYIANELDNLLKLCQDKVDDITDRSRGGYGNKKSSGLEDAIFEISGLSNGFHSSIEEGVAELQELNSGLPRIGKWIIGSLKNVGNKIDLPQLIKQETSKKSGVAEAGMSDQHKENHLKAVRAYQAKKKAEKEQRSADSKAAFGSMFGGSPADLTKNLKIRESGKLKEDATGGGTGSSSVAVTMQTLGEKGAFSKKEINKKLGGYTNQLTSGGPVKIGKAK